MNALQEPSESEFAEQTVAIALSVGARAEAAEQMADALRTALEHIHNTALTMATSSKTPSALYAFNHLAALAAEALEQR